MKRTVGYLCLGAIVSVAGACSTAVETNANRNMNANTVPSNVGVVTNNNGNKNTAGVSPINSNQSGTPRNGNANK